jgi:formylglycine-generating enzyme required for sulfatase activity
MKKIYLTLFIVCLIISIFATQLIIHKTDGTQVTFNINEIESISFSATPPPPLGSMVVVEGGTFQTNSGQYTVTLSSFYMSNYLITQAEWEEVMVNNNNHISATPSQFVGDSNRPVENVSWYDAIVYLNFRSIQEGLTPVYSKNGDTNPDNWGVCPIIRDGEWDSIIMNMDVNGYRLPTEMEWEWAVRGGVPAQQAGTFYTLYSGSDNIDEVAWYDGNNTPNGTKPVGTKAPNELGLYDMSGNLWEWCWDWHALHVPGTYLNPTGPDSGLSRCLRGGGFWFWSRKLYDGYS